MNTETVKNKTEQTGKPITIVIDERLNSLKGKILAPRKLEEANRILKTLKTPIPR